MKTFLALIVGVLIGVAVVSYLRGNRVRPSSPPETMTNTGAARPATDTLDDKLRTLKLRGEDIKEELARTGRVIRQKAEQAGRTLSDATADARATAAIKGKLVADSDLSALSISVNTTDGVVTLSGTVSSEEHIGKAMLLAMETEGVHQVVSTLQVKAK